MTTPAAATAITKSGCVGSGAKTALALVGDKAPPAGKADGGPGQNKSEYGHSAPLFIIGEKGIVLKRRARNGV